MASEPSDDIPLPPAQLAASTLTVSGLCVERGGRQVLRDVAFSVAPGEALLLTGPNGAGKSTLIRAILGLVPRTAGGITVDGSDDAEDVARRCHYLGHRDALKTALDVSENLAFWVRFLGGPGLSVHEALDAVDLLDLADLPAAYLSAGQRRRLAIARLIAVERPIWLLDEPTAALDAASERRLLLLMRRHLAAGGSIVAATHLALDLCQARELRLEPRVLEAVP